MDSNNKNKKIKLVIEQVVKQTLKEFRTDFRWNEFKQLKSDLERINYAQGTANEPRLPLLGNGSSRVVFALPNTKYVLKVAAGEKGRAQNQQEVEVFTNPGTKPIVAKVFDSSSDYSWIVSETVRQLPDSSSGMDEFYKLTGLNFSIVTKLIWLIDEYKGKWKENLGKEFSRNSQIFQNVEKNYLNNPFISHIESLITNIGVAPGDLTKLDSWGKTADGRLVILDYGLSKDIWNKHYKTNNAPAVVPPPPASAKKEPGEKTPKTVPQRLKKIFRQ